MKGIKKVFLGLVFMTLFSVGFNVSAKAAAPNKGPTIEVKGTEGGGVEWTVTVYLDENFRSFPEDPDRFDYPYTLKGLGDAPITISLITEDDSGELINKISYTYGEETYTKTVNKTTTLSFAELKKDGVKAQLQPIETGVKGFEFSAEKGGRAAGVPGDNVISLPVFAYEVTGEIKNGPGDASIKYSSNDHYLMAGEDIMLTVETEKIPRKDAEADGEDVVYKLSSDGWKGDKVNISDKTVKSAKVTMTEDAGPQTVSVNYDKVTMSFTPDINEKVELTPGKSKSFEIKVLPDAAYDKNNLSSVKIAGELVENTDPWSGKVFTVQPDSKLTARGKVDLYIELDDGNRFHRYITIVDEPSPTEDYTIKVVSNPPKAATVEAINGTKSGSTITASDGQEIILKVKSQLDSYEFVEWSTTAKGITIEDPTNPEGAYFTVSGTQKTIEIIANFTNNKPIDIDTVKVSHDKNDKLTIKLSQFTDGDPEIVISDLSWDKNYIKLKGDPTATVLKASKISVQGVKAGESKLVIGSTEADVKVFDYPKIEGSSSKVVVTMPEEDWHDNSGKLYNWEDVDGTKIVYKGDDKEKSPDVYSLDDNKKSFGWLELSKKLKDDYDYDCDTITMKAYPANGSKYDNEFYAEIKLYKIKLDESGGAKYTINDEDVSDYFYAADCLEYRIKSKAKDGGTFSKWDNSNNDNYSSADGGTFKPSSAKTFKAIYTGSNTTSSSYYSYSSSSTMTGRTTATGAGGTGGSGSDYDDVPKTGESKTDIWILWSVLLISILGAGFMIYKRFGLVRAIAEADREEAEAVQQEMREKQEKEKENVINTLKGLRKL